MMNIMRHIVAISLWLASLSAGMTYVVDNQADTSHHCGTIECHHQLQLTCCHQHNNDAERVTPTTAPSPTLRTSHITARHAMSALAQSASHNTSAHYDFPTYLTSTLGVRAADYFLYTLCRLRI